MSVRFTSIHTVSDGDTLAALVARYRLSSAAAILDIEPNARIRAQLSEDGALPTGLAVHIPPNAAQLARDRLYRLQEIRPVLLSHFDTMRDLAETDLQPVLRDTGDPLSSADVLKELESLRQFVERSVESIASNAASLISIGVAMSATHAGDAADRAVLDNASDPRSGLYWAVTPPVLEQWESMWNRALWQSRWQGGGSDDAWTNAAQYKTTVRSIVIQQIDARIRDTQQLERRLQSEA